MKNAIHLINIAGKGFLGGLSIGAALFGLLFFSLSYHTGQFLNIIAIFTIISGSACTLIAIKFKTPTTNQNNN